MKSDTIDAAYSVKELYTELIALKNYRPSERVNFLFSQLVQCVLNQQNDHGLSAKEIRNLQSICQHAEYEMEMYWAKRIIQSEKPQYELALFPYMKNYQKLTRLEWYSLLSCATHDVHKICFVGSGPLPMTAIILAQQFEQEVTIIEKDNQAFHISKQLIKTLKLEKKIHVVLCDGAEFDAYANYNVIIVAALAGVEEEDKKNIMMKMKKDSNKETHILARSSWGMRELLYRPIDQNFEHFFHPVMEIVPKHDVINSIIIFKNS